MRRSQVADTHQTQTEAARLEKLREQDGRPLLPPKALRPLLSGSTIRPGQEQAAHQMFQKCVTDLRSAPNEESERCLYFLSLVFSNYYGIKQEFRRMRALLESALEASRSPRHQQVILAMLSRTAARLGEMQAADAWLALCDPKSEDLVADSAYRLARALLATKRENYHDVLETLGRAEEVPTSDENDAACAVLRANALERLEGVDAGARELARQASRSLNSWLIMLRNRDSNRDAGIELCPQSFPRAETMVPAWRRSAKTVPLGCTAVFLLVLGSFVIDALAEYQGGPSNYGMASYGIVGVLLIFGLPRLIAVYRGWSSLAPRARG